MPPLRNHLKREQSSACEEAQGMGTRPQDTNCCTWAMLPQPPGKGLLKGREQSRGALWHEGRPPMAATHTRGLTQQQGPVHHRDTRAGWADRHCLLRWPRLWLLPHLEALCKQHTAHQ